MSAHPGSPGWPVGPSSYVPQGIRNQDAHQGLASGEKPYPDHSSNSSPGGSSYGSLKGGAMGGNPFFDALCGAIALIGVIAVLFCMVLTAVASRERGAIGLFVLAILFCCLLVAIILLPILI